ncbi:hypothetical protein BHE97_13490 [Aeromicrobium sp. PE09-221]|uniref:hypothetical protein n=1 Tax=Aeromicrobium sp. PE09-221 TaxID=1898043 RepID=UPI000B3EB59D|nr:hypothetical protein [Aeromicrobium sp. PE09-221]OUZ08243.1 hypothetical protein BHE97_13490 [Aeromicrobium sp. PE09-221]
MIWRSAACLVLSALVGWLVAGQVSTVLDLRVEEGSTIPEDPVVAEPVDPVEAPAIVSISVDDDPAVVEAAEVLGDALRARQRPAPRWVSVADDPMLTVEVDQDVERESEESSRLVAVDDDRWILRASSARGAAQGLVALADRIRSGREPWVTETITPDLPTRMVDFGAVGVRPRESQWRGGEDYGHASRAFEDVILAEPPYVDTEALERHRPAFERFVRQSVANGYNAMAVPGFLEYVRFDETADASDRTHRARATAMRDAFGPWWTYASDRGLDVYLRTDMLALHDPLERYLRARFGGLETSLPAFWDTYGSAFEEIYAAMPQLAGTVIRIGEAGDVYDVAGRDERSELAVTSVAQTRAMLSGLLAAHERAGRDLVFRTWSVGVGEVGALHTDPEVYRRVFDGIDSDRLIVSTKYSEDDFYSHLPLNATLGETGQRRIVEFQSRREYEGMGVLANDLTALHGTALQEAVAANDGIEGVWTWTQDGGPWRAGPMALYLERGWWPLYDLNTYGIGRWARDLDAEPGDISGDWIRSAVSRVPSTQEAVAEALGASRSAILDGLYISAFAEKRVHALGLLPPPMMWIFEWDVLAGDTATWSVIGTVVGDDVREAVQEGRDAVATARTMLRQVRSTPANSWNDEASHASATQILEYELSLLEMLSWFRSTALHHAAWVRTGDDAHAVAADRSRERYREARDAHRETYGDRVDLPAYNTVAADAAMIRQERDQLIATIASVLLGLVIGWLLLGAVAALTGLRAGVFALARWHWSGLVRPWAVRPDHSAFALGVLPGIVVIATEVMWGWGQAPVHAATVAACWLLGLTTLSLVTSRRSRRRWAAALGGVSLVHSALVLYALSGHGPSGYWAVAWTDERSRTAYVIATIVVAGWALAAVAMAARRRGAVLVSLGVVVLGLGIALITVGLDPALRTWSDELGILPWTLARTLGISTHLGIPAWIVWVPLAAGGLIGIAGIVRLRGTRRSATRAPAGG